MIATTWHGACNIAGMNAQKILNAAISQNPHDMQEAISAATVAMGRLLHSEEVAWIALFY